MMGKLVRLTVPVAILVFGILCYHFLSQEEEKAKRPKPAPKPVRTRVAELQRGDYETVIRTQGVVRPHNEVTLTAQVSGRITRILPGFEDGAFFEDGEVLLELDASDFETAVIRAEASLARARMLHAQEKTRADQARLNWEDLGYEEEPNELVLRMPQLREAEANVRSADAQLEQARRDLERARVRSPFSGRVRERRVGLGQTIGGTTPLGTVFAIDFAEVRLPISGQDIGFLALPEDPDDPSLSIRLRDALHPEGETYWDASIVRTEGVLDRSSLELFVIARIEDPFGRRTGHVPLRIGQPVIGLVPGRTLEDVVVIPRTAVRKLENVYLVHKRDMTIHRKTIAPIFADEDHLVVRDPAMTADYWLSTSFLFYAPDGASVQILPEPGTTESGVAGSTNAVSRTDT